MNTAAALKRNGDLIMYTTHYSCEQLLESDDNMMAHSRNDEVYDTKNHRGIKRRDQSSATYDVLHPLLSTSPQSDDSTSQQVNPRMIGTRNSSNNNYLDYNVSIGQITNESMLHYSCAASTSLSLGNYKVPKIITSSNQMIKMQTIYMNGKCANYITSRNANQVVSQAGCNNDKSNRAVTIGEKQRSPISRRRKGVPQRAPMGTA